MNRSISFGQYRSIDLTLMAVLLAVSQWVISFAVSRWFPEQLYVVSPAAAMTALVMMRWNGWAAIHAVLAGVLYAGLSGGTWQHFLIYGIGNLLGLAALAFFPILGKERIRKDAFWSLVFALCAQLLMQLGRAAVAAALGASADACFGFITTDLLSELFTMFVIWAVRRIDGLFEDQKQYLLRIQSEQLS